MNPTHGERAVLQALACYGPLTDAGLEMRLYPCAPGPASLLWSAWRLVGWGLVERRQHWKGKPGVDSPLRQYRLTRAGHEFARREVF